MISIEQFHNSELDQVVQIFNHNHCYYQIDQKMFDTIVFSNENYDPSLFLVAKKNEVIIGYTVGIKRKVVYGNRGLQQDRGWILSLEVIDNDEKTAKLLLENIEKLIDREKIIGGSFSPQYFFYGIDLDDKWLTDFYVNNGYILGNQHYWMEKDLTNYCINDEVIEIQNRLASEGINFEDCKESDEEELLSFIENNFTTGWYYSAKSMKENKTLSIYTIVAKDKGNIIGYVSSCMDNDERRYGPFGVDSNYRGRKIGTVLMHLMFNKIKNNGNKMCFFKSTDIKARRLYEREHMEVKHIFVECEKSIK